MRARHEGVTPVETRMNRNRKSEKAAPQRAAILVAIALLVAPAVAGADVLYSVDDGTAELGLGIDSGEDMVWMNRFPVQSGGEVITSISAAYGRPGGQTIPNGLAVSILLYQDTNGGSPFDATLLREIPAFTANCNTNILNDYPIPATAVSGDLIAAVMLRNRTGVTLFLAPLDRTAPSFNDSSFFAYNVGLDQFNLETVPLANRGTTESLGAAGNFLLRANGTAIPEPTTIVFATCAALTYGAAIRRSRR